MGEARGGEIVTILGGVEELQLEQGGEWGAEVEEELGKG